MVAGGRFDWLELPPERIGQSIFVEGDLVVDGCLENTGLLFVTGSVRARDIYTQGYLVMMGDVGVERLVGVDEPYGTFILGDLTAGQFVMWGNHQYAVGGATDCAAVVHDEIDGAPAVWDVVSSWGVPCGDGVVDHHALQRVMHAAEPLERYDRVRAAIAGLARDLSAVPGRLRPVHSARHPGHPVHLATAMPTGTRP